MKEPDRIANLDAIAKQFKQEKGFNRLLSERYDALKIFELGKGSKVLELGCGEGLITNGLVKQFDRIVAIDGSSVCLRCAKRRIKNNSKVTFIHSSFESFETDELFDTIIMAHILEHVEDPILLLQKAGRWLNRNGYIIIIVPNAESFHRRVGKIMGLIRDVHELAEADFIAGHRRYYDTNLLREDILSSGLVVERIGGILLKPLSNAQMEQWSPAITDAFYELSKELPPEYCAEIWARCVLPEAKEA